jgi:hypothetical protein
MARIVHRPFDKRTLVPPNFSIWSIQLTDDNPVKSNCDWQLEMKVGNQGGYCISNSYIDILTPSDVEFTVIHLINPFDRYCRSLGYANARDLQIHSISTFETSFPPKKISMGLLRYVVLCSYKIRGGLRECVFMGRSKIWWTHDLHIR